MSQLRSSIFCSKLNAGILASKQDLKDMTVSYVAFEFLPDQFSSVFLTIRYHKVL